MNITLNIERLVLEGVELSPHQRPLLQAAVEAELARLLTAHDLAASLQSDGSLARLPGTAIQLTHPAVPDHLGRQIAQAIYASLGGSIAGSERIPAP